MLITNTAIDKNITNELIILFQCIKIYYIMTLIGLGIPVWRISIFMKCILKSLHSSYNKFIIIAYLDCLDGYKNSKLSRIDEFNSNSNYNVLHDDEYDYMKIFYQDL